MATLPSASVAVDPTASAPAGGSNLVCVMAPVATDPDMIPRLYGSADAVVEAHGYSEGAEYAAMHVAATGLPFLFCGMPINTVGAVSRTSTHGNTGTSVPSVVAGGSGFLAEHDGRVRVVVGGTIGTSQIKLELSLDGGKSYLSVRLGTATSFALPDVGGTVSFAAGTLVAGDDILEWHGSGPLPATSDLATVRSELAQRQFRFRDALLTGDLANSAAADAVVAQANAYATSNKRHVGFACSVPDRLPLASMSKTTWRMTGEPTLTFAEVGASGDTIARSSGSWIADGAVVGDTFVITGTSSNDGTYVIASLSASTITLGSEDLDAEVSTATVVGGPTLTFAEVGGTGDTITRSRGSWLADGFRVGGLLTSTGAVDSTNNVTAAPIAGVTATVITMGSTDLDAESIRASLMTITQGETKAAWMQRIDDAFASVDAQPRIVLGAGRCTFPSPYSGWHRRVPSTWIASCRAYQHDLHVAEHRKDHGSIGGASLEDHLGDPVEWNDEADGGAGSVARFTTLRTWANGPQGVYVTQCLTRAGDGQLASSRAKQSVINNVCNTVQTATENAIGRDVTLNSDGTMTKDELNSLAAEVNAALELEVLSSRGEGARASAVKYTPNPLDVYNVAEPVSNGTVTLLLNGTTHTFATRVQVVANGQ
jgi:hypothetical protein